MNKFLCSENRKRQRFSWSYCDTCTYFSRCADYQKDKQAEIRGEENNSTRYDERRYTESIDKEEE